PWVLFGQLGLMLSFLSMVLIPDPLNNITMLSVMGFTVSFFGAFQDVATDGMAVDIIPAEQQAKANGLMWGAKVLGTSASLASGTWLINNMGFPYAVSALSITVFLIMMLPLFLRERTGEKRFPWQRGEPSREALAMKVESWGEILFTLKNVFILRTSLALAVMGFVFCIGIGFMDALLPIYTIQELGWTNDAYSNVLASVSTVGAFLAMAVAGWLVERIGKVRILNIYFILMIAIPITVALTRSHWMVPGFGVWLIVGYMTIYTFIMVAYLATAMNLCWKRVAATQFTLYMAIGNMGRAVGSSLLGPTREHFDWPGTFMVYALFMAMALVTVQAFQFIAHQRSLDRLEEDHLATLPPDLGGPLVPR
ncbi:MAG: MFS transporter, partial [Flavobacteriales bacterium]